MAEVLTEFDSGRGSYPWGTWTDGRVYRATQGEDFACAINGFVASLRSYARRHAYSVRVSVKADDAKVTFQFAKNDSPRRRSKSRK